MKLLCSTRGTNFIYIFIENDGHRFRPYNFYEKRDTQIEYVVFHKSLLIAASLLLLLHFIIRIYN